MIDHSTMQIGNQHYSEIVKEVKKYLTTDCSLQDICKNFRYAQSRSLRNGLQTAGRKRTDGQRVLEEKA